MIFRAYLLGKRYGMIGLVISTIVTSAADSLNPIAIVQQFVLQGMVKKPRHIWYFILPTGITNLIGGFLAYYGFVAFLSGLFHRLAERFSLLLMAGELVLGLALLTAFILKLIRIKKGKNKDQPPQERVETGTEETDMAKKIRSVSPAALVALGVAATISELATALPYFAFLAILFNYQLTFFQVSCILVLYNFIYTLPLMLLYYIYRRKQQQFDRLYSMVKVQMAKWKNVITTALLVAAGGFLTIHALVRIL